MFYSHLNARVGVLSLGRGQRRSHDRRKGRPTPGPGGPISFIARASLGRTGAKPPGADSEYFAVFAKLTDEAALEKKIDFWFAEK